MPQTNIKNAMAFIMVTVLIDSIGFGVVIPVLPGLLRTLSGSSVEGAAQISGWLMFGYAIMQFAFGPVMGALSDRFGRRPVLLASLLCFGVDYLAMAFAPTLAWLLVGRLIAGVTGASFNTAYAYIADVSPPEKRAANFGRIGLAFGLGFIIGPALGGILGDIAPRLPFMVAAGLALVNAAYGYFVLPESLGVADRRPFEWRRANPIGALLRLRQAQPKVLALASATFLWVLGHQALQGTWGFYTIYRFGWSPAAIGYSLAAVGVTSIIVQGGLMDKLVPRYGERRLVVIGSLSGLAGYLIYAFADQGWMMYLGIAAAGLSGLVYPSVQGLMSNLTARGEQGELQGAVASLFSLATIIGPPVMTQGFAFFTSPAAPFQLPGAAFVLSAGLTLGMLVLFMRAMRMADSAAVVKEAAAK
jgi:DHA1 family tetracycline resistance protein-like MFS transporter